MNSLNSDQISSLVRTLLKMIGAALMAHGASQVASFINAEDVSGLVVSLVGVLWSHFNHAAPPASATGTIAGTINQTKPPVS